MKSEPQHKWIHDEEDGEVGKTDKDGRKRVMEWRERLKKR